MPDELPPLADWQRQDLPPMLSRRFEFASYGETRRFLDDVARIAEEVGHYPNLSFGKTYVTVTLDADGRKLTAEIMLLAQRIEALVAKG